ncbi:C-type lectin domain family 9 member A-like protein [Labeo rohita]|uniref:C-type lectin domain family 9 member A-like protein n=1 Tax=Labeo rohita TaxID=84645 RepID=A0A498NCD6_LABRO|nr:C-type lectin domain family 9 member A-like protein [Labeo rohita]
MEEELCYSTVIFKPNSNEKSDYIHMSKYNNILAQHTKEKATNLQLLADKQVLDQERARLMTWGEQMNTTLHLILKKSYFLVDIYCQSTENGVQCTPCPKKWIQNGSSCYYFYKDWPWKPWTESKEYCKRYGAQLAIIDSVEEQISWILDWTLFDRKYLGLDHWR